MDNDDSLDFNALMQSNSIREGKDRVFLDVEVTPNSARREIKGYNRWRDRLIIKLRSQARKGRANAELLILLGDVLNIDSNKLSIIKGAHSTEKTVELLGLDREEVIKLIFEALNE